MFIFRKFFLIDNLKKIFLFFLYCALVYLKRFIAIIVLSLPRSIPICFIQLKHQFACLIVTVDITASVKKIKIILKTARSVQITMNSNSIGYQMKKLISHVFIFQRSSHHAGKYLSAIGSHRCIFRSEITEYRE